MLQFVRVPTWGLDWCNDARYYGRHWCAHVGPWLIFIWQCTEADLDAFWREYTKR